MGKGGDIFLFIRSYNHLIKTKSSFVANYVKVVNVEKLNSLRLCVRVKTKQSKIEKGLYAHQMYDNETKKWYQHYQQNFGCLFRLMYLFNKKISIGPKKTIKSIVQDERVVHVQCSNNLQNVCHNSSGGDEHAQGSKIAHLAATANRLYRSQFEVGQCCRRPAWAWLAGARQVRQARCACKLYVCWLSVRWQVWMYVVVITTI